MTATSNETTVLYEPPNRISCVAAATITGRRGVFVSATKLPTPTTVANTVVPPAIASVVTVTQVATAGQRPDGISAWDLLTGELGLMIRWGVVAMEVGAAGCTAGQQGMLDATGRLVNWAFAASMANWPIGMIWQTGAVGTNALVALSL